jgi:hypothetical protein
VKAFAVWLADQAGYKSKICYSDAEYFNINAKDARVAHAQRNTAYPSLDQCPILYDDGQFLPEFSRGKPQLAPMV